MQNLALHVVPAVGQVSLLLSMSLEALSEEQAEESKRRRTSATKLSANQVLPLDGVVVPPQPQRAGDTGDAYASNREISDDGSGNETLDDICAGRSKLRQFFSSSPKKAALPKKPNGRNGKKGGLLSCSSAFALCV